MEKIFTCKPLFIAMWLGSVALAHSQTTWSPNDSLFLKLGGEAYANATAENDSLHPYGLALFDSLGPYAHRKGVPYLSGIFHFYYAFALDDHGKRDQAIPLMEKARDYFSQADSTTWGVLAEYNLGYFSQMTGRYITAIASFQSVYDYYREKKDTASMSGVCTYIALAYHDMREYGKGIEAGKKGWRLIQNSLAKQDFDKVYRILNSIAINYDDKGEYETALAYYDTILAQPSAENHPYLIEAVANNQGFTLLKIKDFENAEAKLRFSLSEKLKRSTDHYALATGYTNMLILFSETCQRDSATKYLKLAGHHSLTSHSAEKIQDYYKEKKRYHKSFGEFEQAYLALEKYHRYKDSLFDIGKARIISDLEMRYETKEKETEIQAGLLKIEKQEARLKRSLAMIVIMGLLLALGVLTAILWRSRIRRRQQVLLTQKEKQWRQAQVSAVMESQEGERGRIAADLHDSVGQLLSTLNLNLNHLDEDAITENQRKNITKALSLAGNINRELREAIFNLMPATLKNNGLPAALEELCQRMKTEGLDFHLDTDPNLPHLPPQQALYIFRIAQEWLNNIAKYSGARQVFISLFVDGDEIGLTIENDGKGFSPEKLDSSKGHGWKNINTRAEILQATVEIQTEEDGQGCLFILRCQPGVGVKA